MANVKFLRGSNANLISNVKGKATDGTFYLTTDTHRLYVGQGTELVELNKSITVVNSLTDLPTSVTDESKSIKGSNVAVGQFYYVNSGANSKSGNILAVCTAINNGAISWTQVNPDTVGYTTFTEDEVGFDKDTTQEGKIKYTATLGLQNYDANNGEINLDSDATVASTLSFEISSEDLATLSGTNVKLESKFDESKKEITLNTNEDTKSTIVVGAGDGINIAKTDDNKYSISNAITGATLYTDENGVLKIALSENNDNNIPEDGVEFDGEICTKSYIDDELKALNAMVYKGTLSNTNASEILTGGSNRIGDMYLVSADIANTDYKKGDLLIANVKSGKTETTEGTIASSDLKWERIESTKDTDTTYKFAGSLNSSNDELTLEHSTTANVGAGSVNLLAGESLSFKKSGEKFEINHDNVNQNVINLAPTKNQEGNVYTFKKYKVSLSGHVTEDTGSEDVVISIPSYTYSTSLEKVNNAVTVENKIVDNNNVESAAMFDLNSSSLKLGVEKAASNKNAKISIDLEWGTFPTR